MTNSDNLILDLTKKCLKKVPKEDDAQNVRVLLLDNNELQKIDNIDSYLRIEKLSLSRNQLLRMYGVCRLHCLQELNLSYNGIITIEGLKELTLLTHLNLEGNNIKTIEHLNANTKLEYLNLSENSIGSISDISFLKCLKELYLHGNRITHLRQCDKYLPISLEILTLAKNNISDLNEICTLTNLCNLHTISINDNPCVKMTGKSDGFDHRPFILNWCMSVKVIDGFVVDPIESLKAEWLYSQGKGRQFRIGDQEALARYLSSVCPLLGKALESENERKLRLILSKAQQHQRQLQEEISECSNSSGSNLSLQTKKKQISRIQSPRFSRLSGRQGSPDSMSNSYHGNMSSSSIVSTDLLSNSNSLLQMTTSLIENIKNDNIMSQSVDGITCGNINSGKIILNADQESSSNTLYNQCNDQQASITKTDGQLTAASKMVPVPESLMSPDCCPAVVSQCVPINTSTNQTQIEFMRHNMNKSSRSCSPKIIDSPHLKRSEIQNLSPRKENVVSSPQSMKKSCLSDSKKNSSHLTSNSVDVSASEEPISSDDDSEHINIDKLTTIKNKAAQRNKLSKEKSDMPSASTNKELELSAVMIQKVWRGYQVRKKVKYVTHSLLKRRTQDYIEKLCKDMEMTKTQLENERKIQQLQMHAINALWKKVSSMQSETTNKLVDQNLISPQETENSCKTKRQTDSTETVVNDLAKTCSQLTTQVHQLQGSMRDILNCMAVFCNLPTDRVKNTLAGPIDKNCAATQTEIVAVHTPQLENSFNFTFKARPSFLPLDTDDESNLQSKINSVAGENESDNLPKDDVEEKIPENK